jgi:uncharacterized membrane protein YdjX (TVP38/TMEM64 family)
MFRLLWIFLGLALIFMLPFLLWGADWNWTPEETVTWLETQGPWAWAVALGLLMGDLFLPIPSSAIMAGLGLIYGPLWGGLVGAIGSCMAGTMGYGICRIFGQKAVTRLLGKSEEIRSKAMCQRYGGWLVALSRWLPLMPEVIACMAGFLRMPWTTFITALACGTIPMAFTFALVGHLGAEHPSLSILLSAAIPPFLWWIIGRHLAHGAQLGQD